MFWLVAFACPRWISAVSAEKSVLRTALDAACPLSAALASRSMAARLMPLTAPSWITRLRSPATLERIFCGNNPAIVSLPWSEAEPERSEEHTSELQSPDHLVCRLLLEKKKS